MRKYYFEVNGFKSCLTPCTVHKKIKLKKDLEYPIYIGSVTCQRCTHNKGFSVEESWIKCDCLHEAIKINKLKILVDYAR